MLAALHDLATARREGTLPVFWLGLGIDPLTLVADLLAVAVFDAKLFHAVFPQLAATNDEGRLVRMNDEAGATTGVPFTEQTVERFALHRYFGNVAEIGFGDRTRAMAVIIALAWLLAMLGLFGWLLWWDRSDGPDQQEPPRTLAAILDEAVARAMDRRRAPPVGDPGRLPQRLPRHALDPRYAREHPAHERLLDLAPTLTRDATREGIDRELEIVAMKLARPRPPDQTPD